MEKKQTTVRKIVRSCQIALGDATYTVAVVLSIVSNGLITGGIMELALLVSYTMGTPISLFVSIFNITVLPFGTWTLDRQFALTTALNTVIYPLMLRLLEGLGFGDFVMREKLVVITCAGILVGVGIGIVIRVGTSTRGMDISSLVLKRRSKVNVPFSLYLMDCIILGLQLIPADSHAILYGALLIIAYTMVPNKVLTSGNVRIQMKIVSRKCETVNRLIAERLDCGTPFLHMETEYLYREQEMILVVIARRDLPRLNQLAMNEDPEALMIINQINEVRGRGFTLERVYQDSTYQEQIYQEQKEGSV